jgi:hypothetical protein
MFALGCILHETTTGVKLFEGDFAVCEYAASYKSLKTWPDCDAGSQLHSLGRLALALLDVDPFKRAGAVKTAKILTSIHKGIDTETGPTDDNENFPFTVDPSTVQRGAPALGINYRSVELDAFSWPDAPPVPWTFKLPTRKHQNTSSYWRVTKLERFPKYLELLGKNWLKIAEELGMKTPGQVCISRRDR